MMINPSGWIYAFSVNEKTLYNIYDNNYNTICENVKQRLVYSSQNETPNKYRLGKLGTFVGKGNDVSRNH